jgi:hypothetical protein
MRAPLAISIEAARSRWRNEVSRQAEAAAGIIARRFLFLFFCEISRDFSVRVL